MLNSIIIYTADDEEPICSRCDHLCDSFGCDFKCDEYCGPEHWWNGYERTVNNTFSD